MIEKVGYYITLAYLQNRHDIDFVFDTKACILFIVNGTIKNNTNNIRYVN